MVGLHRANPEELGPDDAAPSGLGDLAILGLMWSPAVAALVTTFIYQRNIRGLGWSPGKGKYLGLGYLLPIVYAAIAYGIVVALVFARLPLPGSGRPGSRADKLAVTVQAG